MKIQALLTPLTVFLFAISVDSELTFDVFQLKTPVDYHLRNNLIEYITTHPGVDILKFNIDEIEIAVPKIDLNSFMKVGIFENGSDIFERNVIYKEYDNGVRSLMQKLRKGDVRLEFDRQPSYSTIIRFLRSLSARFPQKIDLKRIGKTIKNQYIFTATVSAQKIDYKNGIFLYAGIYGNEWISVLVTLYVIQELVLNTHSHPLIGTFTWIIIPVINPDGYRHAYRYSEERVWHKNKNCMQPCAIGECGVDILRNFPWNFQGLGSSKHPCSMFYAGKKPFSEVESLVLSRALAKNKEIIKLCVEIHGYGGAILYPWGYSHIPCNDYQDMEQLAQIAANTMSVANYTVGNLGAVTYPNAGGPLDYAKGQLQIKFVYALQMRSSDNRSKFESYVKEAFTGKVRINGFGGIQNVSPTKRQFAIINA